MNIMTYPTADVASQKLAERIKHEVDSNEAYYLALSGGVNAPILYRALVEADIDWKKVYVFFAFEVASGVQKGFNYKIAKAHLFDKVPLNPDHVYPINIDEDEDVEAIKERYIQIVSDVVPTLDGHHRFNMVLLEMHDDGQVVGLHPGDEEHYDNKAPYLVNKRPQDEANVITIGFEALGAAKSLVFYAFGEKLRFMVGNIINLMPEAKLYPANYLIALYPWAYIYADGEAMREKSYAIY